MHIVGTGSYLPKKIVTNYQVSQLNNTDPQWALEKIGIRTRFISEDNEYTSDIAVGAVNSALDSAGMKAKDLELLILATATPDMQAPSTASIVQKKIGALNCVSFDISAACSGFLYALSIAYSLMETGNYLRGAVVGADRFSTITDWTKKDSYFFGDGAGAVILSRSPEKKIFEFNLKNDPKGVYNFSVPFGKAFQMDGKKVYECALALVTQEASTLFKRCHIVPEYIDHVIPHQPSVHLLADIAESISIPFNKFHTNMDRLANTAGATIPIVLDEALRSGYIFRGQKLLFLAAGAGMTGGVILAEY